MRFGFAAAHKMPAEKQTRIFGMEPDIRQNKKQKHSTEKEMSEQ